MITDRCSTLGLFFILYGEYGCEANMKIFQIVSSVIINIYVLDQHHLLIYFINIYVALSSQLFQMLAILDISSHWCQMYASASLQLHHKSAEGNANRFFLVRYYYQCYPFFGYCCVSAEITYVAMYALKHAAVEEQGKVFIDFLTFILTVCVPGCAIKQIVNIFQLLTSCNAVAMNDAKRKNE